MSDNWEKIIELAEKQGFVTWYQVMMLREAEASTELDRDQTHVVE